MMIPPSCPNKACEIANDWKTNKFKQHFHCNGFTFKHLSKRDHVRVWLSSCWVPWMFCASFATMVHIFCLPVRISNGQEEHTMRNTMMFPWSLRGFGRGFAQEQFVGIFKTPDTEFSNADKPVGASFKSIVDSVVWWEQKKTTRYEWRRGTWRRRVRKLKNVIIPLLTLTFLSDSQTSPWPIVTRRTLVADTR